MNLQPSYDIKAIQAEQKAEGRKFTKAIDTIRALELHPDVEADIIAKLGVAYDVRVENIGIKHITAKKTQQGAPNE